MFNLKITGKILTGYLIIAILGIVIGIIGLNGSSNIAKGLNDIQSNFFPSTKAIGDIRTALLDIKASVRTLLIPNISENMINDQLKYIPEGLETVSAASAIYDPFEKTKEEDQKWKEFKDLYNAWKEEVQQFRKLSQEYASSIKNNTQKVNENLNALRQFAFGDFRNGFRKLDEIIDVLTKINIQESKDAKMESEQVVSSSKSNIIIITILSFLFAIAIGFYISTKFIKNPINLLIETFTKVTSGDLKVTSDIKTKDEFGMLSDNLNKMIKSQRDTTIDILDRTNKLNESSNNLLKISEQVASASSELASQTSSGAASSEQVTANVSTVSSATEEMSSSIKEISKSTNNASKITEEAKEKAGNANEVMARLGVSSTEIGSIVKVITSIAEQTNLLALNATIEAARAGELGKGFAVVANEVKELAKESAKATEDISNRIKMIQDDSSNAISAIGEIIHINQQVNDLTNTIASAVEEQSVTVSEVSRNLVEARSGVISISEITAGISLTANEYSKIANDLKTSARDLMQLAKNMEKALLEKYKI